MTEPIALTIQISGSGDALLRRSNLPFFVKVVVLSTLCLKVECFGVVFVVVVPLLLCALVRLKKKKKLTFTSLLLFYRSLYSSTSPSVFREKPKVPDQPSLSSPCTDMLVLHCLYDRAWPFRRGVSFLPGVEEMKCPLCCTYRRQHIVHTSDAISLDIQIRTAVTAECL